MDQNKLSFLAHRSHAFASPVSVEALDRVISVADPKPGTLAFDLGCGAGNMAVHLAQRWGLQVKAVDRSPLMIAEAERRLAEHAAAPAPAAGAVQFHCDSSVDFLKRQGQADMLVAIGAIGLTEGQQDAASVMRALTANVKPGGCLLWGETHWRRPPSDMLRLLLGPTVEVYDTHAEYVHAGAAADLLPLYAVSASEQAWDEYTWRYTTALENHLRDHPDDLDAAEIRNRAQGWRSLYLAEGRDAMGFGLYLFRKPG